MPYQKNNTKKYKTYGHYNIRLLIHIVNVAFQNVINITTNQYFYNIIVVFNKFLIKIFISYQYMAANCMYYSKINDIEEHVL